MPLGVFGMQTFGNNQDWDQFKLLNISVAMVLGAGVNPSGDPSGILRNRLDKSVELFQAGIINQILVSGDNRELNYNEPVAMQKYLISKGILANQITLDYAGRSTFDSCWRARNVFGITRLIVVTQAFHLPRSVFSCNSLGIETFTATAKDANSASTRYGILRETGANWGAIWSVFNNQKAEVGSDGSERQLN